MGETAEATDLEAVYASKKMLLGQAYAQLLHMESTNSDTWVLGIHPQVLLSSCEPSESPAKDVSGNAFVEKVGQLLVDNAINNPRLRKISLNYGADVMPAAFVSKLLEIQAKARETKPEFSFEISWNIMKDQSMKWWVDYLGLFSDVGVAQLSIGPEFFENCTAEQLVDIRSLLAVSQISEISVCAVDSADYWQGLEVIAEAFGEVKGLKTISIAERIIPVSLVLKYIQFALKNPSLENIEVGIVEDPEFDFAEVESLEDIGLEEPRINLMMAIANHTNSEEVLKFAELLKHKVPIKKIEVSFCSIDLVRPFIAQCVPEKVIEFFPGIDLETEEHEEEEETESKSDVELPCIEFGSEFDIFAKSRRLTFMSIKVANPSVLSRCTDLRQLGILINPEVSQDEFVSAIASLKSLEHLSLYVDPQLFASDPVYHWNIVDAIGDLGIAKIDIDGPEEFWTKVETFKKLVSESSSLKSIKLEGTSRSSLLAILHSLKSNKTLKEFVCIPSDWSCETSAYASTESASAEDSESSRRLSEEMADVTLEIFSSNKSLTTLDIHLNPLDFTDPDSDRLNRLLKSNSSITSFTFDWDLETLDPFFSISEPILSWLESNKAKTSV